MKKKDIYCLLEEKLFGYLDYIEVPVNSCDEALLSIPTTPYLKTSPIDEEMFACTGDRIYVRQTVLEKLSQAAELLASQDPAMEFEVVYGYRTREIQRNLFEKCQLKLKERFSGAQLLEAAHKDIAHPDVAGHPTGGAVDIQILNNGRPLDFGTKIWEFAKDSLTFSPFISREAWHHRQQLRRIMMAVGFAPHDGEWWHFSYGDKEWAKYYEKPFALYEQLEFKPKFRKNGAAISMDF